MAETNIGMAGSPRALPEVPSKQGVQNEISSCVALRTTVDQLNCLSKYLNHLEGLLTDVCRDLNSFLPDDRRSFLKEVQRAWVDFREATIEFEASNAGTGSLSRVERLTISIVMTADRIRHLNSLLP